ncbi:MAG: hypothetical protein ACTHQQ_23285 [Solirubrobacteraceae bacterium]
MTIITIATITQALPNASSSQPGDQQQRQRWGDDPLGDELLRPVKRGNRRGFRAADNGHKRRIDEQRPEPDDYSRNVDRQRDGRQTDRGHNHRGRLGVVWACSVMSVHREVRAACRSWRGDRDQRDDREHCDDDCAGAGITSVASYDPNPNANESPAGLSCTAADTGPAPASHSGLTTMPLLARRSSSRSHGLVFSCWYMGFSWNASMSVSRRRGLGDGI